MRFVMTESEALWIKQKYNFGQLLGLNVKQRIKFGTEKALREKGVIYPFAGHDELKVEYRALFSYWSKMRYSIARPELNTKDHFQCLLSNEEIIIFFVREKDQITIDLFDFSVERFEKMVKAFAEMDEQISADKKFNITISVEDYEAFMESKNTENYAVWQRKWGIETAVLEKYAQTIMSPQEQLLLVEDHVGEVGYLAKIVNAADGIYGFKHVTRGDNQKIVLLLGDAQFVMDSIYNF